MPQLFFFQPLEAFHSGQFSKRIANRICDCVYYWWMHVLRHNSNENAILQTYNVYHLHFRIQCVWMEHNKIKWRSQIPLCVHFWCLAQKPIKQCTLQAMFVFRKFAFSFELSIYASTNSNNNNKEKKNTSANTICNSFKNLHGKYFHCICWHLDIFKAIFLNPASLKPSCLKYWLNKKAHKSRDTISLFSCNLLCNSWGNSINLI